jgi:hypothetical protein
MSWRQPQPPPPRQPPESVTLLRALGDLQRENDDEPIEELDMLAAAIGREMVDLPVLINRGIDKGFIAEDIAGAVGLTPKGWRWYEHDEERRH